MSKKIKGRIDAWITNRGYPAAADLFTADEAEILNDVFYSTLDMSESGWVKVGTAEITVTLDEPPEIASKQIAALQGQLEEMRAEHQLQQTALLGRINNLLAIEA
jgi:hypothetical protein